MQQAENFINEGLVLSGLLEHEVATALLSDFDEGIASHVLHTYDAKLGELETEPSSKLTFMGLVHEFEKLIDDGLEELPMCLQESRILADNIHDI